MFKKGLLMKLAVIGSRKLKGIKIEEYIPDGVTEIVSGGADGVDTLAKEFANRREILLVEFLPNYKKYGKGAPLVRNREIAEYADEALALWDGESRGTAYTVKLFQKLNKRVKIVIINEK